MMSFIRAAWPWLAVAILAGVVFMHFQQDAATERALVAMTKNRDAWRTNALAWRASFKASEQLRDQERKTALDDAKATQGQCEARVAAARRSQQAIRSIVERPPTVVNGCPAREQVGAGELRGALQ